MTLYCYVFCYQGPIEVKVNEQKRVMLVWNFSMHQAKEEIKVIAYLIFVHISRTTLLMEGLFFHPDCWCKKKHFVCLSILTIPISVQPEQR